MLRNFGYDSTVGLTIIKKTDAAKDARSKDKVKMRNAEEERDFTATEPQPETNHR